MAEGACIHSLYAAMIALDWRLFAIGWVLSIVGFALAYPSAREA